MLGARWDIKEVPDGLLVNYANLRDGIEFRCGICSKEIPIDVLLEWILSEGDAGDLVFFDEKWYFQTMKEGKA